MQIAISHTCYSCYSIFYCYSIYHCYLLLSRLCTWLLILSHLFFKNLKPIRRKVHSFTLRDFPSYLNSHVWFLKGTALNGQVHEFIHKSIHPQNRKPYQLWSPLLKYVHRRLKNDQFQVTFIQIQLEVITTIYMIKNCHINKNCIP